MKEADNSGDHTGSTSGRDSGDQGSDRKRKRERRRCAVCRFRRYADGNRTGDSEPVFRRCGGTGYSETDAFR